MLDAIEYIDDRDEVVRTEFGRYRKGEGRVHTEMWHDAEGLQAVVQKAIEGHVSQKALLQYAEERAIASRETRVNDMYPGMLDQLKDKYSDEDFEYRRKD